MALSCFIQTVPQKSPSFLAPMYIIGKTCSKILTYNKLTTIYYVRVEKKKRLVREKIKNTQSKNLNAMDGKPTWICTFLVETYHALSCSSKPRGWYRLRNVRDGRDLPPAPQSKLFSSIPWDPGLGVLSGAMYITGDFSTYVSQ